MESAEGVAAKPGDNRSGDTPPKRGTGTCWSLGADTWRASVLLGVLAAATHPRGGLGARLHLATQPWARTVGSHIPTPSPRARGFPGLMPRGPKTVAGERGPGRLTCAARGRPHSPRASPAPSPTAGTGQAGWALRPWLLEAAAWGRGRVHFPARPSSSDHGATLCSDYPHPHHAPVGHNQPCPPHPDFHPDHMPWTRLQPRTAVAQTCPGGIALPTPNYHPVPSMSSDWVWLQRDKGPSPAKSRTPR